MDQVNLQAILREKGSSNQAQRLRKQQLVPAVFYGKQQENLNIAVNSFDLEKAVSGEQGTNTVLNLKVEGKGDYPVLLRDYQAHPIKRNFLHADFVYLDLTKQIHVSIPITLVGKSVGVKEGGILEQIAREIEVLCLPTNIPNMIEVDITELKLGESLHLNDVKLPDGVEASSKANVTIASIVEAKEEKPAEEGATSEPELVAKKSEAGDDKKAAAKDDKK